MKRRCRESSPSLKSQKCCQPVPSSTGAAGAGQALAAATAEVTQPWAAPFQLGGNPQPAHHAFQRADPLFSWGRGMGKEGDLLGNCLLCLPSTPAPPFQLQGVGKQAFPELRGIIWEPGKERTFQTPPPPKPGDFPSQALKQSRNFAEPQPGAPASGRFRFTGTPLLNNPSSTCLFGLAEQTAEGRRRRRKKTPKQNSPRRGIPGARRGCSWERKQDTPAG